MNNYVFSAQNNNEGGNKRSSIKHKPSGILRAVSQAKVRQDRDIGL